MKKTETVIFKSKRKRFNVELKIKLNGKILYSTKIVKSFGVKIEENVTCQHHINDLSIMVNRDGTLFFKMKNIVDSNILKSIYFVIFVSHLNYWNLV